MRYLGLDFGTKKIGLALSDPGGRLAFPYATLHRTTNQALFDALLEIVDQEQVEAIVVGVPVTSGDRDSLTARQAINFIQRLQRRTSLPVFQVDETLTTAEAEERLRRAGISARQRKSRLDQAAAACILETFLQSRT